MNIVLLAGSPSAQSRSTRLLQHVGEQLLSQGLPAGLLSVRDLPAEALLHADFSNPALQAAIEKIKQADALVLATPVYQASYSGVLKAFLDVLPQFALATQPVLPLAVGGSQSHMLALDYALRPVLSALGSPHILPGIYATEGQIQWNNETGLILDAPIAERVARGVAHLGSTLQFLSQKTDSAPLLRRA